MLKSKKTSANAGQMDGKMKTTVRMATWTLWIVKLMIVAIGDQNQILNAVQWLKNIAVSPKERCVNAGQMIGGTKTTVSQGILTNGLVKTIIVAIMNAVQWLKNLAVSPKKRCVNATQIIGGTKTSVSQVNSTQGLVNSIIVAIGDQKKIGNVVKRLATMFTSLGDDAN